MVKVHAPHGGWSGGEQVCLLFLCVARFAYVRLGTLVHHGGDNMEQEIEKEEEETDGWHLRLGILDLS